MLGRFLSQHYERAYWLLRVLTGLMFALHGSRKLFGLLSGHMPMVGSQLWVGGVIELVTGLCVAFGLLTVWMAFLASGTMAVAYVQFHWQFEFGELLIPTRNQGELAVLYSLMFFLIACKGPGTGSLDHALGGAGRRDKPDTSAEDSSRKSV